MARRISMSVLLACLLVSGLATADPATFDLAEYVAPAGFTAQAVGDQLVLTHVDAERQLYQIIAMFKSHPSAGSPERDFAGEWQDTVAKTFVAPDAPAPATARTPGKTVFLEGGTTAATGDNSAYVHLWVFELGDRVQSMMIVTPTRASFDAARSTLAAFLRDLRFRGPASKPAPAKINDRAKPAPIVPAPIVGVWLGFKDVVGQNDNLATGTSELQLSKLSLRWRTFLADGSSFEGLPNQGLLDLDVEAARKDPRYGAFWGTWTTSGDKVIARQPSGRVQEYHLSGDELREDPKSTGRAVYWRAKSVDGLRLDGRWSSWQGWDDAQAAPTWKTRPLITFTADGRFVDEGAFMGNPVDDVDPTSEGRPGRGTYRIDTFTLVLRYDDGHELRRPFMAPMKRDPARDSPVVFIGQFPFYRR